MSIDVSAICNAVDPVQLAATVWLPPSQTLSEPPVIVFALPGGGYAKGYFDIKLPGHLDYSQAENYVSRGFIFIALDHLGVGASSLPAPATITFESLAATYNSAVRILSDKIRSGALHPDFAAIDRFAKIGIGHSMGGCVSILAQGRYASFDAIASLGYSVINVRIPHANAQSSLPEDVGDWTFPFHWEDVPPDIREADLRGGFPERITTPPWGSRTMPPCVMRMAEPGAVAKEAAAVSVPVFIGVGERDICPNPRAEPATYASTGDISLRIFPRMAHMHNFASTRRMLWHELAEWIDRVAVRALASPHFL